MSVHLDSGGPACTGCLLGSAACIPKEKAVRACNKLVETTIEISLIQDKSK